MKAIDTLFDTQNAVLTELGSDFLHSHGVRLFVKRDDLIDQEVSGNKWRKLKYNVEKCLADKKEGILTFGGAFSNHLVATSAACKKAGLKSVGIVRGDELNSDSNDTLKRCTANGMELRFISRSEYKLRSDGAYRERLMTEYPSFYFVPEGGANYYGMIGCQEMVGEIKIDFDHIFVAQGTTATSCGILMGMKQNQMLHAVPVLKKFDAVKEMSDLFMKSSIESETITSLMSQLKVHDEYHFGGYGKFSNELLDFIEAFYQEYDIKLDPVYTGKAMFALFDQIKESKLSDSLIVFVHTGGLQGIQGIAERSGRQLFGLQ